MSMKSWRVMGEVLCWEIAFRCLEVVLANSQGSMAWVMYCSRSQRGGESRLYMGEGFAGSWGAKGMKNKNKTKISKRKRRKYDVFEDRAVASVRSCPGGTSPCVRRVFFLGFPRKRRRSRRKRRVFVRFRQGTLRFYMFFRCFCIPKSAEAFPHVLPRVGIAPTL